MKYLRHHVVIVGTLLLTSSWALAQWTLRNKLEAGMTDNATLSDTNKESDFLMSLGTTSTYRLSEHAFGLRLGYRDYSKENSNDVLSWGLFDQTKCFSDKNCSVQLKGQEYVYGEPMTTDSSFSNYGLLASVEKSSEINSRSTLDITGSYEAKNYYSQNRLDNTISIQAVLGFEPRPVIYLEALGESGLVISSNNDFSAMYFELAGTVEYRHSKDLEFSGEIDLKQTRFLSRDISSTAQITRGNRVITTQSSTKETYSLVSLGGEANYHFSMDDYFGLSLYNRQQRSHSGYQDYSETELLAKVFINF